MILPEPMLASTGRVDLARLVESGDWLFEEKVNGVRVLLGWDGRKVWMRSRGGQWLHDLFPELCTVTPEMRMPPEASWVLDAELQLIGQASGELRLQHLMSRVNRSAPTRATSYGQAWLGQVTAFDLLMFNNTVLHALPLLERTNRLAELLEMDWIGALPVRRGPAQELLDATRAEGREGVMAKRLDSRYAPGRRVSWWLKFKNRISITAIGFDYTASEAPQRLFGALRLAMVDASGRVRPVGEVGSGMSEFELRTLKQKIDTRQFPVVSVSCLGRTDGGLREPVFSRILPNVPVTEAHLEQLKQLPYT